MRSEMLEDLPGAEFVLEGLEHLQHGVVSVSSLLVEIGAPRLRFLGISVPPSTRSDLPEHRLYDLLEVENPANAYSRYNALIRRLVSFERSLQSRKTRTDGQHGAIRCTTNTTSETH